MYDMAENEEYVDFLHHLSFIRNQRISMVEKPEQYALAHKVILEGYKEGLFDKNWIGAIFYIFPLKEILSFNKYMYFVTEFK